MNNRPQRLTMKITICICTCRHPLGLARLLDGLNSLDFDGAISLVVIDNDDAQEGIAVCEATVASRRWPMIWGFESRPGISQARNASIRMALEQNPDFIAFIDDDEVPDAAWLGELIRMRDLHDADAVAGPVLPTFDGETPTWARGRNYYDNQRFRDGARISISGGGNCLVRASCFVPFMPNPFDLDFALTGGEDYEFYQRFEQAGFSAVWADHAIVHEYLTTDKMTKAWLRRRRYCYC